MFFIMGISNGEKKLKFDQLEICNSCGQYGHVEVYMTYMYFMFFFLPLFKWKKRYYVRMSCCGTSCEINTEVGKKIEQGELSHISMQDLHFSQKTDRRKQCSSCGFTTTEDFLYCPKCGGRL